LERVTEARLRALAGRSGDFRQHSPFLFFGFQSKSAHNEQSVMANVNSTLNDDCLGQDLRRWGRAQLGACTFLARRVKRLENWSEASELPRDSISLARFPNFAEATTLRSDEPFTVDPLLNAQPQPLPVL
jgi:hypothetical protein